jgi:hypothetical protein
MLFLDFLDNNKRSRKTQEYRPMPHCELLFFVGFKPQWQLDLDQDVKVFPQLLPQQQRVEQQEGH